MPVERHPPLDTGLFNRRDRGDIVQAAMGKGNVVVANRIKG